jgi:hypothetical protein
MFRKERAINKLTLDEVDIVLAICDFYLSEAYKQAMIDKKPGDTTFLINDDEICNVANSRIYNCGITQLVYNKRKHIIYICLRHPEIFNGQNGKNKKDLTEFISNKLKTPIKISLERDILSKCLYISHYEQDDEF